MIITCFRLLDEYGWLQFAQSKGTKIRIQLIEKIFEDASFANARDPRALPLNYTELKQLLGDILVGAGIPNLTPVSSLAFGEGELCLRLNSFLIQTDVLFFS